MHVHRRGLLYLLAAVLLWSTAEVVMRGIHTEIGPIQLAWIRFTLGALLLMGLLPSDLRRKQLRLNRKVLLDAAWLAVPGVVALSLALQFALTMTGAAVVATIFGATPILVFVLSRLILGDPLTFERFLGVLLGFLGIVVLASTKPSDTFSMGGFALMLLNISCFAFFTVMVKRRAGPYAGLPITALCCAFGALYLFPLTFLDVMPWSAPDFGKLAPTLLYLGFGTTGLAYLGYFTGLEHVDATQAVSVILLKPPLAALLAWAVLGEPLTWQLLLSMTLILGGLYLVNALLRRRAHKVGDT